MIDGVEDDFSRGAVNGEPGVEKNGGGEDGSRRQ